MARFSSTSSDWSNKWDPENDFCSGLGMESEGEVIELRFHTVTAKDKVERYIAMRLKMHNMFKTELDKYGVEISVDPSAYGKHPSSLTADQAVELIKYRESLFGKLLDKVHPGEDNVLEFWALASSEARHFSTGDVIHLRTQGDSWLLKSFFHMEKGQFSHLDGGQVMNEISKLSDKFTGMGTLPQDDAEGCESDEWSD